MYGTTLKILEYCLKSNTYRANDSHEIVCVCDLLKCGYILQEDCIWGSYFHCQAFMELNAKRTTFGEFNFTRMWFVDSLKSVNCKPMNIIICYPSTLLWCTIHNMCAELAK